MYIAQSFFHSLIAAIIIDRAIQIWDIRSPLVRQRFRLMVIPLPILSFPAYQLINPDRGAIGFRLEALLDINGWLNLELWRKIPLSTFFILILFITTMIFLLQEMIPILRHTFESNNSETETTIPDENSVVNKALSGLPVEKPDIFMMEDDNPLLFSTTGRKPAVFLSTGLINKFDAEQLQAALAHEIAHITRSKRPLLIIIFFLRILMFFNPVILLEFRRIVQEEEKVCDDYALSLTNKPHALIETLKKLHSAHDAPVFNGAKKISSMIRAIEDYSHNTLLENRIARLERGISGKADGRWFEVTVTLGAILLINYFIV